jgi:ribose transport system substrate-binding protein
MLRRQVLALSLVTVASAACGSKKGAAKTTIAVIPKGTTHEFWKSVHAGGAKAAKELGVDITWKGPLKEDDLKAQIDVVQSFIAQGVSGIVLAPLNDKGLTGAVKQAVEAKIPVVIFDSDLQGSDHKSFVATDNFAAGKIAGEAMAKLLGDKGKVIVLRYQEGSASTEKRENGFLEAIKAHSGIEVVSSNQYAGPTTDSASSASENLLGAKSAADGGVNGVFCPNESTTFGMLLALERINLAGKVKFIGFDSSSKLVEALSAGKIDGLVLQNPMNMGYLAVKTMSQILKGEAVEARIDTGAQLVTKDNMNEPAQKALLSPDLKQWLGE